MKLYLSLLLCFPFLSAAQENGYFKQKNLFTLNSQGNIPLLYNLYNKKNYIDLLKSSSKVSLAQEADFFNGGFNFGYTRIVNNSFGFGLEFGMNFSNCPGPDRGRSYSFIDEEYHFYQFNHERLSLSTWSLMPKIEFKLFDSGMPIGVQGFFGIGYTSTSVLEKDYIVKPQTFNQWEFDPSKTVNPKTNYSGMSIAIGVNVRRAITRRFMLNYGIRYSVNPTFKSRASGIFYYGEYTNDPEYYTNSYEIVELIKYSRLVSLMSVNLGLSFSL